MKLASLFAPLSVMLFSNCASHIKSPEAYQKFRDQQETQTVPGGELKYIDKGEGEVLLLLHGVPSSGWLYRKMIDGLVNQGYRVIVPDMIGYGNSSSPEGYELYSPDKQAQRLVALMDKLGIKTWSQVFHDVGGTWTWELMKNHEHRINKLIILNTIITAEGFHPPVKMRPGILAKTAMWGYRNGITTNLLLKGLFKEALNNPKSLSLSDIAGYQTPLIEGKTHGMYYFFTQTCNNSPDYSDVIAKVSTPTTVIWGRNDKMLQWQPQEEKVQQFLPLESEDIHLIDAKHFIQEEQPELVNQLIVDFLKK